MTFKPHKLIPFYLKAADILLANYSSKCMSLEWMSPVKIFEYMASRTPIVATRVGRMIEICDESECVLTNPDDPKDLSEKIEFLMNNYELQKKLIENAYSKAKEHTYLKRCRKIIEFIK